MIGPRGLTARQAIGVNNGDADGRLGKNAFHGPLREFRMLDGNGDGFVAREEIESRWRALMAR